MLSLPWKPKRKLRISQIKEGHYVITFMFDIVTDSDFNTMIGDDLASCLNNDDRLVNPDWESKSVELITNDLDAFQKRVIFEAFVIVND